MITGAMALPPSESLESSRVIRPFYEQRPSRTFWVLLLLVLAVFTSLSSLPQINPVHRDSGVFLYGGWRLLNGELPYIDFWDHKPPIVYMLNALALSLGMGLWGLWLLETAFLATGAGVFFCGISRTFGRMPAFVAAGYAILLLRHPAFFGGGNFTESWAACLVLLLLGCISYSPLTSWSWCTVGFLGGCMFFLKQSCVAVPLTIVVFAVLGIASRKSGPLRVLVLVLAGFFLVTIPAVLIMVSFGCLGEFWSANVVFNSYYLAEGTRSSGVVGFFSRSIRSFEHYGLLGPVALSVCSLALVPFFTENNRMVFLGRLIPVAIAAEIVFISLPQRFYGHYFLCLIPLLSVGFAAWCRIVTKMTQTIGLSKCLRTVSTAVFTGIFFLTGSGPISVTGLARQIKSSLVTRDASTFEHDILSFLRSCKTGPLFIWGAETRFNISSIRTSPTRYTYMYPLTYPGYSQRERLVELLNDLVDSPGTIIIDSLANSPNRLGVDRSAVPCIGIDYSSAWKEIPESQMLPMREYVAARYSQSNVLSCGWVAYIPREDQTVSRPSVERRE